MFKYDGSGQANFQSMQFLPNDNHDGSTAPFLALVWNLDEKVELKIWNIDER